MPLSDHEQRLLEQIEQALYAEDPKFATAVASRKMRSHPRRKLALAIVGAIAGLALVAVGVTVHPVVIVLGFVLAVVSCTFAVRVVRGPTGGDLTIVDGTTPRVQSSRPTAHSDNLRRRMEDRFKRRFDE
ncbi:MAG: hypothetical protein JWN61_1713 [Pseudonocardiales bacterium]|nr:hypothetical protein [Jatrophihabitantaceae bacterium]MCW2603578.1 hypothetical protein [Pseudonocardiales bacterium]